MVADKQPMDASVVSDVAVAIVKSNDLGDLLHENGGWISRQANPGAANCWKIAS
jgi:hypothetical protein